MPDDVALFLLSAGRDRPAEADPAQPRRLPAQRVPQRRGVRLRPGHRLPGDPAGQPKLPARVPWPARDVVGRRPRRARARPQAGDGVRADRARAGDRLLPGPGARDPLARGARAQRRRPGRAWPLLQVGGAPGPGDRAPDRAGPRLPPAAGLRDGRRAAQLHRAAIPTICDRDPGTPASATRTRSASWNQTATMSHPARRASCSRAGRTRCAATTPPRSTTRARSPPTASTGPRRHRGPRPRGELRSPGPGEGLINRGGEKISAEEIEDLVLAPPGAARRRRRNARPGARRADVPVRRAARRREPLTLSPS